MSDMNEIMEFDAASLLVPLDRATPEFERRLPLLFCLLLGMEEISFFARVWKHADGDLMVYSISFPPEWDSSKIPIDPTFNADGGWTKPEGCERIIIESVRGGGKGDH